VIRADAASLRFLIFVEVFFDAHVLEFACFENFAALKAFDELGIFVAADDLHARMLAWWFGTWNGRERL